MDKTLCEECNGSGYIVINRHMIHRCLKCKGFGGFDFVEIITESFKYKTAPSMYAIVRKWTLDTGLGFLELRVKENWAYGTQYGHKKR